MFDPLIWTRLVHFAATISVTGAIFFAAFVAEPAFREAKTESKMVATMRSRLAAIRWVGLAVTIVSGAAWLFLKAAEMADLPLAEALSEGAAWTVISETDFGQAWTLRLLIAGLLAASLPWLAGSRLIRSWRKLAVAMVLASCLVGTLAWAGHGAAGTGGQGALHLAADVVHLIASAAWVGALVPLALLLGGAAVEADQVSVTIAKAAVLRFSTLGITSVAALLISGLANTWVLAGSIRALTETDYGRLLLVKIALFLVMVSLAAVNRLWLTPRAVHSFSIDVAKPALRYIGGNALIEASVGVIVIFIVSMLGTMPAGLEALD